MIHFDIKPANILISPAGTLKIGDFGLASRWPRVDPAEILRGSGLGGNLGTAMGARVEKLEREGDRVYMPPEMLRGEFTIAADIFRLVSLRIVQKSADGLVLVSSRWRSRLTSACLMEEVSRTWKRTAKLTLAL